MHGKTFLEAPYPSGVGTPWPIIFANLRETQHSSALQEGQGFSASCLNLLHLLQMYTGKAILSIVLT
jgi:hypothetical protein